MMTQTKIKAGWNILRFVKIATREEHVMWLYKFTADSLAGEHIDFVFKVSVAGQLPQIIRDLVFFTKKKEWWNVFLVEKQINNIPMLMIQKIEEIKNQEEMNERSRVERLKLPI